MLMLANDQMDEIKDLLVDLKDKESDEYMEFLHHCCLCKHKLAGTWITPTGLICDSCHEENEFFALFAL